MILGVLKNKERYYSLHKGFKQAFDFLDKSLLNEPESGKHEILGDSIFAVVMQYDTTPSKEAMWEGHRKYIDIQFVLSGREIVEWADISDALPTAVYDEEKDFFDCGEVGKGTECKLSKGYFAILYPEDLHKPKCDWDKCNNVKKIVVKIAL